MDVSFQNLYPCPPGAVLREKFVGKNLREVPAPAAIVDRAIVHNNCRKMLETCERLRVDFRPHTKTHKSSFARSSNVLTKRKTTEVTRLQIGDNRRHTTKVVVSTVAEAEHLYSLLKGEQNVNVGSIERFPRCIHHAILDPSHQILYGVPLPPSQKPRLAALGKSLGPGSISVMIDHLDQLQAAEEFRKMAGFPVGIFLKVDTGYHRAGVEACSFAFDLLVGTIRSMDYRDILDFQGLYSHAGHSSGGDSDVAALKLLNQEVKILVMAADSAVKLLDHRKSFTLSVGPTPTVTSTQAIRQGVADPENEHANMFLQTLKTVFESSNYTIELHAGVYPFLDLQQQATQASPSKNTSSPTLTEADIALTILAEVSSKYPDRSEPEALIAAGSLALGREPCKSYPGWGLVSDWGMNASPAKHFQPLHPSGWQVGRISQEHGILTRTAEGKGNAAKELEVGQKVRIWPNHACVAGAMFGWYLVVDPAVDDGNTIVDVWVRWRGW